MELIESRAEVERLRASLRTARYAAWHLWYHGDDDGISHEEALAWYPWLGSRENGPPKPDTRDVDEDQRLREMVAEARSVAATLYEYASRGSGPSCSRGCGLGSPTPCRR
jgi:hypothetical protein